MLKRIIFFTLLISLGGFLLAQDVLLLKTGEEIECWITEVGTTDIKYETAEYTGGGIHTIAKSTVFVILYESGKRDVLVKQQAGFAAPKSKTTYTPSEPVRQEPAAQPAYQQEPVRQEPTSRWVYPEQTTTQQEPVRQEPTSRWVYPEQTTNQEDSFEEVEPRKKYKGNYFMMGLGYGHSYGGAGLMLQGRFGGNVGFGIHGGVGYFPEAPVLASGGLKFYYYKWLFIDTQFGLTGWEYYYEYYWNSSGYYYDDSYDHLLYGPSLLTGGEWTWGRKVGFGFHAAVGASYYINAQHFSNWNLAFDLGYVMRF